MTKVLRLCSANEFSPGVVDLIDILTKVESNSFNPDGFVESVRKKYFSEHASKHSSNPERRRVEQAKLANNVKIGLINYKLVDGENFQLTSAGHEILSSEYPHKSFAKHILLNLCGIEIIEAVKSMQTSRETIGKKSLANALNARGFKTFRGRSIPLSTTDHTKMIQWLREANVFPEKGYEINEDVLQSIIGLGTKSIDDIKKLTFEQRAFLETFYHVSKYSPDDEFLTSHVKTICENKYGNVFVKIADQLASKVFKPLTENGWIEIVDPGKGRGGKSGRVVPTEKLLSLKPAIFSIELDTALPPEVRENLSTPLEVVFEQLDSKDTYVKGLALEVLAYKISSSLGLTLSEFRLRGSETNGAEVDLVCDSVNLQYSRWLIQCKNTPGSVVNLSALAKEIGMAYLLKAHVIIIITTGTFSSELVRHADALSESTHLQAVLLDKQALAGYKQNGLSFLIDFFKKNALKTLSIKRCQVNEDR